MLAFIFVSAKKKKPAGNFSVWFLVLNYGVTIALFG
jgi:hypothetical protein